MQTLDIRQPPVLDVENYGLGMIPDDGFLKFFARTGEVHRKMRAQSTGKGPSYSRVFFQNNYALSHKTPESSTVVNGKRQRKTMAAG